MAKVGVFFFVSGEVITDAVPLEEGETYGDSVGFGGHYDFWEALLPRNHAEHLFKKHPYDFFPRGRVVYFKKFGIYRLYADRCMEKADIEKVASTFSLKAYEVARDEHYQCAGCNSEYIDI